MILIDEILKQFRSIEYFAGRERACFEKDGVSLFLEYLGDGPTGGKALRVVRSISGSEVEMHFEKRDLCWLPYYLRDGKTNQETFLYAYAGTGRSLHVDMTAGSTLIQRACLLELNLRAHGFDNFSDENLYHPLFAGGVP